MPTIGKQVARPPAKKKPSSSGSVLSRIVSVDDLEVTGIRLNLYGRGKSGKTRLACTFPKPLLLMGFEDGTKSVRGVDFVRLYKSDEIAQVIEILKEGKYKTAVLDTASALQDIILSEILGLEDTPVQKSWGFASREQWAQCTIQMKERLRSLLDISEKTGLNVVVIAQERNFNQDDAGQQNDLVTPTIGSSLSPSTATWLNAACDYICHMVIRKKYKMKQIEIGGKKSTPIREETGECEYCLQVGPDPVYMTGFRLPPGVSLPDVIVDPNYEKIHALISGKAATNLRK